jgi:type IV pilus assembly protein PilB
MASLDDRQLYPDFGKFKEHLFNSIKLSDQIRDKIIKYRPSELYAIAEDLGMKETNFAELVASFLGLPHAAAIHHEQFQENVMSYDFCRWNSVAPIITETGDSAFLLSNPFDYELLDVLKKKTSLDQPMHLILSSPGNINSLIRNMPDKNGKSSGDAGAGKVLPRDGEDVSLITTVIEDMEPITEDELEKRPVVYVSNNLLYTAVMERASDIHIEPKEKNTVVRFRIDGDLRDIFTLKKQTGIMVISRLKAFAGIDIAERMKPQDGSVEAVINKRTFKLRLATTSTPNGESMIIRILEPSSKPKALDELGMSQDQVKVMQDFATRRYGLILVVGPTGAGKTTTIYSFLSHLDTKTRSLISVEDPVEYRIPNANQQQVNEKAGVTFEALLKSSVRQDPDILYLGEIRDNFSARISLDFASTGHMALSTLHTNNATTAIFRLERLGVTRDVMADALLGIIAQRLFKKLCPYCKKILPITPQEAEMLSPFLDVLPTETAHPVGCDKCIDGYHGREGVYEVLAFDSEMAELIRTGAPILEIREFIQKRGGYMISHHAAQKAKDLMFPVKDVYEKILIEDIKVQRQTPAAQEAASQNALEKKAKVSTSLIIEESKSLGSILLVEDDLDEQKLISRILQNQGYDVSVAADGIDALLLLLKKDFDLIISDINMPNLDGFKFIEIKNQKGIKAPLVFLTSRLEDEDEIKGLELGALDYLKKPIKKNTLLLKVKKALNKPA